MENQDKIYQQFKNAAGKMESKDFAGMEKVWGNIEGKLETKALKTENTTWKKIAVAASILFVATVGYQFLKDSDEEIIVPKESVVSSEPKEIMEESVAEVESKNPLIKENVAEIIKEELHPATKMAVQEGTVANDRTASTPNFMAEPKAEAPADENMEEVVVTAYGIKREPKNIDDYARKKIVEKSEIERESGVFYNRKFDAVSVKRAPETEIEAPKGIQKSEPLVIVDGKAVTGNVSSSAVLSSKDLETVHYLDDPLYIINGVEYTEKELFGPNPTSPYYPLNKQEITSTTVLQGESATNLYGEKGKKGVVVISTKDKKPLKN